MDFVRKPEVLATVNAVGTASIYFILSKRLNALTDEVEEIDNHLSSSIKKISENSRSLQGVTETFKEVLVKFEDHRKTISSFSRNFKKLEDDISDLNDRYDALVEAVKELGGNVDVRKTKKKKKKDEKRKSDRSETSSESESSESEKEKKSKKNSSKPTISVDRKSKETKDESNSDEDFLKKAQASKNNKS